MNPLSFLLIFWQLLIILKDKLIVAIYRLRRLSAHQAKKFGFFPILKDFPSIFLVILILERNGRFHSYVDFHRSVPLKTEIVPFLRSVLEERRTERIGSERCRAGTGKHCSYSYDLLTNSSTQTTHTWNPLKFFLYFFFWFKI